MINKSETSKSCTFRLDADTITDILAMAKYVGKPGNLTAGAVAMFEDWRRLKAAETARLEWAVEAAEKGRDAVAAWHEEYLDALDRRAEAEGD